jgi:hypothetical protein
MLGKLLKYELKAMGRIILPLYLVLILAAGLFAVNIKLNDKTQALSGFMNIISIITTILFVACIFVVVIVMFFLVVQRFYKNLLGQEGYLMFTLPVTTPQLIWSKLLVAIVWTLATGVILFLVAWLTLYQGTINTEFWKELASSLDLFPYLFSSVPKSQWATEVILGVAFAALSVISSFLMFYAAIAVGHSFSNHKVLLSVVFYIVFSVGRQILTFFANIYSAVTWINTESLNSVDPGVFAMNTTRTYTIGNLILSLAAAVLFYLLTRYFLKKKLNLQ